MCRPATALLGPANAISIQRDPLITGGHAASFVGALASGTRDMFIGKHRAGEALRKNNQMPRVESDTR